MAKVSERLRALDRKLLREHRYESPEFWVTTMAKWRRPYVCAFVLAGLSVIPGLFGYHGFVALPIFAVSTAFVAGQMRAEHGRIKGETTLLGKRRPPGV